MTERYFEQLQVDTLSERSGLSVSSAEAKSECVLFKLAKILQKQEGSISQDSYFLQKYIMWGYMETEVV